MRTMDRRRTVVNVVVAGTILMMVVTGVAIREQPTGSILVYDVLVAGAAVVWWLRGGAASWSLMSRSIVAALAIIALGVTGVYQPGDAVILARMAGVPILAALVAKWVVRLGVADAARALAVVSIAVSLLVLLPLLVGNGSVERVADVDRQFDALYPRADRSFVYTSGSVIRSRGPFGHPNEAAGVVAVLTASAFAASMHSSGRRMLGATVLAVGLVAILATGSRASLVAAVVGLVLVSLTVPSKVFGRYRRLLRALFAGLVCIAGLAVAANSASDPRYSYTTRAFSVFDLRGDQSAVGRIETLVAGLRIAADNPLGVGAAQLTDDLGTAHNSFLFVAVAYGGPLALLVTLAFLRLVRGIFPLLAGTVGASDGAVLRVIATVGALVALFLSMFEDRPESTASLAVLSVVVGIYWSSRCLPREDEGHSTVPDPRPPDSGARLLA